ncbi:class I SAM-dependent methyltransferase [Streptomyces sp. NPDC004031]
MLPTAYASLFMDPELNHSSGYFTDDSTPLPEAQRAKNRAVLERCRLEPSLRLLDIGCGWGAAARLAAEEYGARVVGLTIEPEQLAYAALREDEAGPGRPRIDFRLQRWEEFTEPVDRIICVNAFENFTDRESFFPHCRSLLPAGGVMVVLTVTADRKAFRVISKEAFVESAGKAGFEVTVSDSLAPHYVRTLDHYVRNLRARWDEAVAVRGEEWAARDLKFYTECAGYLRRGLNDMFEFTLVAR